MGARIPPYAILSHTWDAEDELVSFDEFRNGRNTKSKGYSKLTGCVEKTLELGLEYCWIDTCCINKTSSAELSEAINSMFNWYRNAEVCLAYLSDFTANDENAVASGLPTGINKCRWFSRGWTLQELLAPSEVVFLDSSWTIIGTKSDDCSVTRVLSDCTGIDADILVGHRDLQDVPNAEKMSWASFRETTRAEDLAYCLLGIFDVHMPLLYGEGSFAFRRLQEEIMKRSDDLSLLLWASKKEKNITEATQLAEQSEEEARARHLAETPFEFSHLRLMSIEEGFKDINAAQYQVKGRGVVVHVGLLCVCPGYFLALPGFRDYHGAYLAVLLKNSDGSLADPEPMKRVLSSKVWRIPPTSFLLENLTMASVLLVDLLKKSTRNPTHGLFDFRANIHVNAHSDPEQSGELEVIRAERKCQSIWNLQADDVRLLIDRYAYEQRHWRDPIVMRLQSDHGRFYDILLEVGFTVNGRINHRACQCNIIEVKRTDQFPDKRIWSIQSHTMPLSSDPTWTYVTRTDYVKVRLERYQLAGEARIGVWLSYQQRTDLSQEAVGAVYSECGNRCHCEHCDFASQQIFGNNRLEALRRDTNDKLRRHLGSQGLSSTSLHQYLNAQRSPSVSRQSLATPESGRISSTSGR